MRVSKTQQKSQENVENCQKSSRQTEGKKTRQKNINTQFQENKVCYVIL